jgi:hypothetical protein
MKKEYFKYEELYVPKEALYALNKIDNELKMLEERLILSRKALNENEKAGQAKRFINHTYPRKKEALLSERAEIVKEHARKRPPIDDFKRSQLITIAVYAIAIILIIVIVKARG